MNKYCILVCFALLMACHPKSSPKVSSKDVLKVEMMAYYQSSGKLGYLVESLKLEENNLKFNIQYQGGCKPHSFRLICDSSLTKTIPAQTNLYLVHENNGDNCTQEIKKELIFDISRLKNLRNNSLLLNIDNLNTVQYETK